MHISRHVVSLDGTPLHSNGYAVVAHNDTTIPKVMQTFSERQKLEKNRQIIDQYRASRVGSYERIHLDRLHHSGTSANVSRTRKNDQSVSGRPARSVLPQRPTPVFKEPTGRNYNPYA